MEQRPRIAVVTSNVLTGLGLKAILEQIIPMAAIDVFDTPDRIAPAEAGRYFHFFVTTRLFVQHSAFFLPCRTRTILLTKGPPQPQFAGMHSIDTAASEEQIVGAILRMHRGAHPAAAADAHPIRPGTLSAREIEVLTLIARGFLNKQIAQQLDIGTTTVISHRRNLTEKLGIRSVSGLTIYAVTMGYVNPDEIRASS